MNLNFNQLSNLIKNKKIYVIFIKLFKKYKNITIDDNYIFYKLNLNNKNIRYNFDDNIKYITYNTKNYDLYRYRKTIQYAFLTNYYYINKSYLNNIYIIYEKYLNLNILKKTKIKIYLGRYIFFDYFYKKLNIINIKFNYINLYKYYYINKFIYRHKVFYKCKHFHKRNVNYLIYQLKQFIFNFFILII